jgi:hypothetical protein
LRFGALATAETEEQVPDGENKFEEFTMLSLTITRRLAAVAAPVLLTSTIAFASGEGINGPTTNTVSIPVAVDQGIRASDVKAALLVCMVTGDSAGAHSLESRIFNTIFGNQPEMVNTDLIPTLVWTFGGMPLPNPAGGVVKPESMFPSIGMNDWKNRLYIKTFLNPWRLSATRDQKQIELIPAFEVPTVTYLKIASDPVYDELGSVVQDAIILNGVSVQVDPELVKNNYIMTFKNETTGQPTKLRINMLEYIECLKSQLQARAKTK